ncbi:hypothetical protein GCM10022215_18020 [Nocardioides fonticola]|uniref:Tail sheath protein subtilisin-like domain-containing protein n=1 Tax=Nocardioides fonticola TaxID=450363 RepID=A0ABP7XHS7_9ACTN
MSRPMTVVTVTTAVQRRGAPTDTGTTFLVFASSTGGPSVPTVCFSKDDATTAGVPSPFADYVADALTQGAPKVVVLKAAAVTPASVTEAEWTAALNKLTVEYGPGQVIIPGVTGTPVQNALLAHAAAFSRAVIIDAASTATASSLTTLAASIAASPGAQFAALVTGWVNFAAVGGGTRQTPGSVIAAGLAARGDAVAGHANNAPMVDQGRGIGVVTRGLSTSVAYTSAELDSLNDGGVTVIRDVLRADSTGALVAVPTLYGWVSVSSSASYKQFNYGRFVMELAYTLGAQMEAFIGRQIDGRGRLFAEVSGALTGILLPYYAANALFGSTSSAAFAVDVAGATTPANIVAGFINANVEVSLSPHTEKVTVNVLTNVAQGVAA